MKYRATVVLEAPEQQQLFDLFGDLVELSVDLANSHPEGCHVEIDDLDPSKIEEC